MKIICALFIVAMIGAVPSHTYFPEWSEWHYSSEQSVNYTAKALHIFLEGNNTFEMGCHLMEKVEGGYTLRIGFNYSISSHAFIAGMRILIQNEILYAEKISGEGFKEIEISISHAYPKNATFTILLYTLGGDMVLSIKKLEIFAPGKDISQGLFLSGIGISMVFIVLGILAGLMYVFDLISRHKIKIERKRIEETASETLSDEELAVISAALFSYMHGKKVRIIKVQQSPWKYVGRIPKRW